MNRKKAVKKELVQPINPANFGWSDEGMPFCCGIAVIGDFSLEQGGTVDLSSVIEEQVTKLKKNLTRVGCFILATTVIAEHDGEVTNDFHQMAADTALEAADFERLAQFRGNTGRLLQLWGYNNSPPSDALIEKVEASWSRFNPIIAEQD